MRIESSAIYRCPHSGATVTAIPWSTDGDEIVSGELRTSDQQGRSYSVRDGIPYFTDLAAEPLTVSERRDLEYYQAEAHSYDAAMEWLFASFQEDEYPVRERMTDCLELRAGGRVLETGCGTCRDSRHIANRIGRNGEFFLQDLSDNMIRIGRARMSELGPEVPKLEFFVGNAMKLPFADGYFDAAYHFGGLNGFSDIAAAVREMARVVRIGGKVVVGDEAIAPWLAEEPYGQILQNSNPLYRNTVPFGSLPISARDVCVRWIIGNAFYLVDFRVGDGPPPLDIDLPIMGRRGGTHRTRYYGVLEGVTPEAKALVEAAAREAGLSLHDWLERAVRAQAKS